jgi:hypothetical protein
VVGEYIEEVDPTATILDPKDAENQDDLDDIRSDKWPVRPLTFAMANKNLNLIKEAIPTYYFKLVDNGTKFKDKPEYRLERGKEVFPTQDIAAARASDKTTKHNQMPLKLILRMLVRLQL